MIRRALLVIAAIVVFPLVVVALWAFVIAMAIEWIITQRIERAADLADRFSLFVEELSQ